MQELIDLVTLIFLLVFRLALLIGAGFLIGVGLKMAGL